MTRAHRIATILDAVADSNLFASWFRDKATWQAWFAFLCVLFALPLSPERLSLFRQHTGRSTPPTRPASEAWLVIGRRGGKSFVMALCAVFLACFYDYRRYLSSRTSSSTRCTASRPTSSRCTACRPDSPSSAYCRISDTP